MGIKKEHAIEFTPLLERSIQLFGQLIQRSDRHWTSRGDQELKSQITFKITVARTRGLDRSRVDQLTA